MLHASLRNAPGWHSSAVPICCAYTLGVTFSLTSLYFWVHWLSMALARLILWCLSATRLRSSLFGICSLVAAMCEPSLGDLGQQPSSAGRNSETCGEMWLLNLWSSPGAATATAWNKKMFGTPCQPVSRRSEQAHFADVVADLGLPVDAQLEDVRIATRYVCSLTLVQLEMLFARVAATWHKG